MLKSNAEEIMAVNDSHELAQRRHERAHTRREQERRQVIDEINLGYYCGPLSLKTTLWAQAVILVIILALIIIFHLLRLRMNKNGAYIALFISPTLLFLMTSLIYPRNDKLRKVLKFFPPTLMYALVYHGYK